VNAPSGFAFLAATVIALPLAGAVFLLFFGKRVGRLSGYIASGTIGLSFLSGLILFFRMLGEPGEERSFVLELYDWVNVGDFHANAELLLDPLSIVMVLVVTGVGTLIHVYSIGYMAGDPRYSRFFAYLNLFCAAMLILVLADNLLFLFVGWEGVGLCSYLLIGFWFEREVAAGAAKKAFIVNRIGDFSFLLGIFLIADEIGSLSVSEVNAGAATMGATLATVGALLLFGGATGKSAQIPLYTWLPDAMEGPTPVSALIHAATMVTAGVYMVVRNHAIFDLAPMALAAVGIIGGITALFAATIGLVQNDIKRVLAYSTDSQLGYMFLACGVGAYSAAIFHLMTHEFFKALLFLSAGSVIHALGGEQDIRKMGGLHDKIPTTYRVFLIGTLAIAGIPPLAGFWSKDEIMAHAFVHGYYHLYLLAAVGAFLTSFYMFRLTYLTFYGSSRVDPHVAHHIHESPSVMTIPLMILAGLALFGGFLGVPPEHGWFHGFLHDVATPLGAEAHEVGWGMLLGLMGVAIAIAL